MINEKHCNLGLTLGNALSQLLRIQQNNTNENSCGKNKTKNKPLFEEKQQQKQQPIKKQTNPKMHLYVVALCLFRVFSRFCFVCFCFFLSPVT